MKYICIECGASFDKPTHWEERHGLDTPPYEQRSGSPCCYGAYTEAHKCDCCGEYIVDDYIKLTSGERICNECYMPMELGEED